LWALSWYRRDIIFWTRPTGAVYGAANSAGELVLCANYKQNHPRRPSTPNSIGFRHLSATVYDYGEEPLPTHFGTSSFSVSIEVTPLVKTLTSESFWLVVIQRGTIQGVECRQVKFRHSRWNLITAVLWLCVGTRYWRHRVRRCPGYCAS